MQLVNEWPGKKPKLLAFHYFKNLQNPCLTWPNTGNHQCAVSFLAQIFIRLKLFTLCGVESDTLLAIK